MSFSYYEIYITCLRAFTAMGFPYGADEDAAFMVSWLELNKLNGVKNLVKISKKINKKFNGSFQLINVESNQKINLNHISLLMKGPGLVEYFFQKIRKKKYIEVILENCVDPIFIIPLVARIAKNNVYINSYWIEKNLMIELNASKKNIIIKKRKNRLKIASNQLLIKISSKSLKPIIKSKKNQCKIDDKVEQKRLEEAINPNKKDWGLILSYAKLTFVPESKVSRAKGAGGGDDND